MQKGSVLGKVSRGYLILLPTASEGTQYPVAKDQRVLATLWQKCAFSKVANTLWIIVRGLIIPSESV
jgi:hypothetical protein